MKSLKLQRFAVNRNAHAHLIRIHFSSFQFLSSLNGSLRYYLFLQSISQDVNNTGPETLPVSVSNCFL